MAKSGTRKSFAELLTIRALLRGLSEGIKNDLRGVYQYDEESEEDYEDKIVHIAHKYGMGQTNIRILASWLHVDAVRKVVIFYNKRNWLDGQSCFDSRVDEEFLPVGSCVVGVVSDRGGVLNLPSLTDNQLSQLKAVVQEAFLDLEAFDAEVEDLVGNGILVF
jgi:hypothetical protein